MVRIVLTLQCCGKGSFYYGGTEQQPRGDD